MSRPSLQRTFPNLKKISASDGEQSNQDPGPVLNQVEAQKALKALIALARPSLGQYPEVDLDLNHKQFS